MSSERANCQCLEIKEQRRTGTGALCDLVMKTSMINESVTRAALASFVQALNAPTLSTGKQVLQR